MVHAVEPLLDAQSVAMRAAGVIKPGSLIGSIGLHNESRVVHPLPRRIAVPCGIGIFGKLAAIGPDHAPVFVTRVQDDHLEGRLKYLHGRQTMKIVTGEAVWIAHFYRIIGLRSRDRVHSKYRLMAVISLQSLFGVGRFMVRVAIGRHGGDSEYPQDSAESKLVYAVHLPYPGHVMPRGRG